MFDFSATVAPPHPPPSLCCLRSRHHRVLVALAPLPLLCLVHLRRRCALAAAATPPRSRCTVRRHCGARPRSVAQLRCQNDPDDYDDPRGNDKLRGQDKPCGHNAATTSRTARTSRAATFDGPSTFSRSATTSCLATTSCQATTSRDCCRWRSIRRDWCTRCGSRMGGRHDAARCRAGRHGTKRAKRNVSQSSRSRDSTHVITKPARHRRPSRV